MQLMLRCEKYRYYLFFSKGLKQLRQAICDFHQKFDQFDYFDPDDVIVGPGSKELIYLVMHVFNGGKQKR